MRPGDVKPRGESAEVAHCHIVHFYETESFPDGASADFLWEGLEAHESAAIVLTPEHAAALRYRLGVRGAAVSALERSDRLVVRDAHRAKAELMIDGGRLDIERFRALAGHLLDDARAAAPSGRVRVFGEVPAMLAAEDQLEAALALERMWTDLVSAHPFALIYCAYPLHLFANEALGAAFLHLCDNHDDVIPVATRLESPARHGRCIAVLQQQAGALRAEIAERRRSEARLHSLVKLSEVLATSLDEETTLAHVLEHVVPALGDFGLVELRGGSTLGATRRVARAPEDPELEARLSSAAPGEGPILSVIAADRAALHTATDDAWMRRAAAGPEELAWMRALAFRSMITVPLSCDGRSLGTLTVFHGRSGRQHDGGDLELLREVGHRASAALWNAQLYRDRAEALRRQVLADRRKDEFLAMLGHELRNPLAPIMTAVELMERRNDVRFERECRIIRRQATHLKLLVEDLLDISRITRGQVELHKERLEISAVLAHAVEVISPLLERRSQRLSIAAPTGLEVFGDAFRLGQVFTALLVNAAKYTDPGGQIRLAARREGSEIVVDTSDTGCGISKELLPVIFEPFIQGERSIDRAQGGLGLGLALVRRLSELHGGVVSAESGGAGQGSTFTVRLPALSFGASGANAKASSAAEPQGPRLLLVDDNRDAIDLLADGLRDAGYEVALAYDGPSALELAAQSPPDVALIDIGLPVMSGHEVAAQLRKTQGGRALRLLAISGYGQDTDREESMKAGFDLHLVKPVSLDTLLEIVEQQLRAGAPAG